MEPTPTQRMKKLLENEDFNEIFMNIFMKQNVYDIIMLQNIDSQATIDELKARQVFKNFVNDMLDYDEKQKLLKGK